MEPVKWYYFKDEQRQGPCDLKELQKLAASGEIQENTLLEVADAPERLEGKYFQAVKLNGLFAKIPFPEIEYPERGGLENAIAFMQFLRIFLLIVTVIYWFVTMDMIVSRSPPGILPWTLGCIFSYMFLWLLLTILIHWSRIFIATERNTQATAFYLRKQLEADRISHNRES